MWNVRTSGEVPWAIARGEGTYVHVINHISGDERWGGSYNSTAEFETAMFL